MFHPYQPYRASTASRKEGKRKVLFESPREFAKDFAESVTAESSSNSHWVAKNGEISLFAVLKKMVPEIAQPEDGRHRLKGKISCAEFNKLVQNDCQFMCSRTRKQCVARVAGNWLFSNRRWLDPSIPRDRQQLEKAYRFLCLKFNAFTQCTFPHFIKCVSIACDAVNQQRFDDHSVSSPDMGFDYESAHADDMYHAASFPVHPHFHSDAAFPFFPAASHMADLPIPAAHFLAGPHHAQASYSSAAVPSAMADPPACAPACTPAPTCAPAEPASITVISSAATSPEESSEDERQLNAGEDMDACLFHHWAANPTLRVEASELESFGRSTSF
mmetsp:Transcript_77800/g.209679  ORF Transcript_77800/g.209679 Transcript_77800/m.209679 type:complete len:331 (-) Transcript_77800:34-1026(-)